MHPTNLALSPSPDLEKSAQIFNNPTADPDDKHASPSLPVPSRFRRWNTKIESLAGLEARGITRVLPEERHAASLTAYVQMALLWFSANVTANNLAVALLGPLVFSLGFVDSALCAVFGVFVGSVATAYMSIWGAQSGNRTMVVARYFMGYTPSKIACVLNIVIMLGYGTINCIIGGQILSAVSGGSLSIVLGIVIVALVSWIIVVFGLAVFHVYERYIVLHAYANMSDGGLGVIANNIPGIYSAALGCQVFGRYAKAVPRYVWTCFIVAVYFDCAMAGRNHLFEIFTNFLALMGYWLVIFISIVLEEHLLFRRDGFDWTAWEDKVRLPVGVAALVAFSVGTYQAWYVGPLAMT